MLLKKLAILSLLPLFMLSGCSKYGSNGGISPFDELKYAQHGQVSQNVDVNDFDSVIINGDFDVEIIAGMEYHDVRVVGDKQAVARISANVIDRTLYLTMNRMPHTKFLEPGKVVLVTKSNQLRHIEHEGKGTVTAIGLKTGKLDVVDHGDGTVNLFGEIGLRNVKVTGAGSVSISGVKTNRLNVFVGDASTVRITGVMNLRTLKFAGNGWLNMYWIDSPFLRVVGNDKAYVQLGGKVGTLEATIYDNSHFDARHLRTKKAYVKTAQSAQADLWVKDAMNTHASGTSNIFYHNVPHFDAEVMDGSGTVLDMHGLPKEKPL